VLLLPGLLLSAGFGSAVAFLGSRSLDARDPALLAPLLSLIGSAIGLLWALSPVLSGVALSEAHDVTRLLHLPIPLRTLVLASLLSNLAQPAALAGLAVTLALAAGLSRGPLGFPLAVLGIVLALGFVIAAAQAAGLVLHAIARNRRFQDVALFLGLGLGFLASLIPVLLLAGGMRWALPLVRRLLAVDAFALSPFSWGLRAAVHGGRLDLPGFLLWGTLAGLGLAGAVFACTYLMERVYRGELMLSPGPGRGTGRARMWLPGPLGALVEKDLRTAWRDPALRASLFMGLVGPLLFLLILIRPGASGQSGNGVLFLAMFIGVALVGSNTFGLERRGIGLLLSFPQPRWQVLVAKNLAAAVFRLPGVLTLLVAGLLLAPASHLPATLAIALATMLVAAGADNFLSILAPVAAPAPGGNPYASSSRGLPAMFLAAALVSGTLLVASPFVFLAWLPLLLQAPWLWWLSLPLAVAGAASVYAMLVALAEKLLVRREPQLLERILVEV
jgi:ABC-2 type transport system permease protein